MPKKAQKPAFDRTVYTTVSIPDDTYAKLKRMADEDDRKISQPLLVILIINTVFSS